ncbi:hypothetical protein FRB99_000319 [Tulasnella sp. 403]|nr:hypothetical protein FRB99_000319 [Tulasnella sp. 403]
MDGGLRASIFENYHWMAPVIDSPNGGAQMPVRTARFSVFGPTSFPQQIPLMEIDETEHAQEESTLGVPPELDFSTSIVESRASRYFDPIPDQTPKRSKFRNNLARLSLVFLDLLINVPQRFRRSWSGPSGKMEDTVMEALGASRRIVGKITFSGPVLGGGSGNVYQGKHPKLGKVAVKCLRESNEEVFITEAKTWLSLKHPRILEFYGIYRKSGMLYMVSPWVDNGMSLAYLQRHPNTDRIRLLTEVAEGLAYVHREGYLHGDVKAANILISTDVHPLICDFGLSRAISTGTNPKLKGYGTYGWQAPELLNGQSKSPQTDVYAFGITISEFLSGKEPYAMDLPQAAIIGAILREERPKPVPMASPDGTSYRLVWRVAQKCWDGDPSTRPRMQKVYRALREVASGSSSG